MQIRILEDVAAFVFEKAIRGRLKKDRIKEFQSGVVIVGSVDSLQGYRKIWDIKNAIPLYCSERKIYQCSCPMGLDCETVIGIVFLDVSSVIFSLCLLV